jgi:arabinogalactan endo-1,4-beta-galactosidase
MESLEAGVSASLTPVPTTMNSVLKSGSHVGIAAKALFACLLPALAVSASGASFVNGSDASWYTQMVASGIKFFNTSGVQQPCLQVLQGSGIQAIRLRVWLNPSGGWCNQADVVAKAVAAKNLGLQVLIDFHYSDTWADPGHQTPPAAWSGHTISQMYTDVWTETTNMMVALKAAGVTPTWVQIGNETNNGMLWPNGEASLHMNQFAGLITSGYNGVKQTFPNTLVVVHISNGYDDSLFRWVFDGLKANGAKYDVIGMSLYPTTSNWATLDSEALSTMKDMQSRYGKQVMVCEVGMDVNSASTCEAFLKDIIAKTKSVGGLGVFYWEPESYNSWQGYTMGAFGSNGEPTVAMSAF